VRLSFVIPSYNSATWVVQAIRSCLEQTHKDIEVVVVDDCSTDSTEQAILSRWVDPGLQAKKEKCLRYIRNAKNLGRSASRNVGNKAASGAVICVLDADDLALPSRAAATVKAFERGAHFLYGSAVPMDTCGRYGAEIWADTFDKQKALDTLSCHIVHSTVAYSREFAEKYPYLEGEPARLGVDDFTQQIRAALDGVRFDFVPQVLSAYRVLGSSITARRNNDEVIKFKREFVEGLKSAV